MTATLNISWLPFQDEHREAVFKMLGLKAVLLLVCSL